MCSEARRTSDDIEQQQQLLLLLPPPPPPPPPPLLLLLRFSALSTCSPLSSPHFYFLQALAPAK
jgi:hypothetical protein